MKAPDKVYIDDLAVVNDCVTKLSLKQLSNFSEYIRKDTLLEWAKKKYTEYKQLDEDFQGNVFVGNCQAFAEIIVKIESL